MPRYAGSAKRSTPVEDITLQPGRDYEVIRGRNYRFHDEASCSQCQDHCLSGLSSWPKVHVTRQSGRHPKTSPLALSAPPLELYLLRPLTPRLPSRGFSPISNPLVPRSMGALGSFLDDIFSFIEDIVKSVIAAVERVLARILHDLAHPMDLLKDLVQVTADFMTGKTFLDALASFPLTRWLYVGLDWLTGGFLTNLRTFTSLPGRFLTGQKISRADLLAALSVLKVILIVAIGVVTGGATLAIIGASVGLLKAGPIGKTALGRTILDIVGIGLAAVCGDTDILQAFINAGQDHLKGTLIGAAASKLGINAAIVSLTSAGVAYAAGSGGDEDDSGDDEGEDDFVADDTISTSQSSDSSPNATTADGSSADGSSADSATDDNSSDASEPNAAVDDPSVNESFTASDSSPSDSSEPEDDEESDSESDSASESSGDSSSEELPSSDEAASVDENPSGVSDSESESSGDSESVSDEDASEMPEEDPDSEDDASEAESDEEESGLSDEDLAEILKAGLALTNLSSTLLKKGYSPSQAAAALKQAKRVVKKGPVVKKPKSGSSNSSGASISSSSSRTSSLFTASSSQAWLLAGAAAFALLALSGKKKSS